MNKRLDLIEKRVNLAIIAGEMVEELDGDTNNTFLNDISDRRDIIVSLINNLIDSIGVSNDNILMETLMSANKYLRNASNLIDSLQSSSGVGDQTELVKDLMVKGSANYVLFVLKFVGIHFQGVKDAVMELSPEQREPYFQRFDVIHEGLTELYQITKDIELVDRFGSIDYNKDHNITIEVENATGEETEDDVFELDENGKPIGWGDEDDNLADMSWKTDKQEPTLDLSKLVEED